MDMRTGIISIFTAFMIIFGAALLPAQATEADNRAAEMARQLQDPLAGISAIQTENPVSFNDAGGKTSYQFNIEPIFSIDFSEYGFSLIPRAVIPITGTAPMPGGPDGDDLTWGLSDIVTQFFVAPKVTSAFKWGAGIQASLDTHTDDLLAGPGWGAGPSAIVVGDISEQVSFAAILGHLWSFDGKFSQSTLQPMFYYNMTSIQGAYLGYEGTLSLDWEAERSGDAYTVPLGLVAGKTFDLGGGYGLDINLGPYWNVIKPEDAADWSIKLSITIMLP